MEAKLASMEATWRPSWLPRCNMEAKLASMEATCRPSWPPWVPRGEHMEAKLA
jgi:hypothetical protein